MMIYLQYHRTEFNRFIGGALTAAAAVARSASKVDSFSYLGEKERTTAVTAREDYLRRTSHGLNCSRTLTLISTLSLIII